MQVPSTTLLLLACCTWYSCRGWLLPRPVIAPSAFRRRGNGNCFSPHYQDPAAMLSQPRHRAARTTLHLWKAWGLGGNNGTASSHEGKGDKAEMKNEGAAKDSEDDVEEDDDDMDSQALLGDSGADEDSIIIDGVDDDEDEFLHGNKKNADVPRGPKSELEKTESGRFASAYSISPTASGSPPTFPDTGSMESTTVKQLTEKSLAQSDENSFFDGFEGFAGRRVSYSSQPKARHNIVFEIWRQRSPEEIAILYKGQHQYSASRRVQEAINEQVSTLLGMFLREPDFQSHLQIQGGQLANLFFKLQLMGYMFANADKVLSASSSLNIKNKARQPPVGSLEGTLTVVPGGRRNVLGSGEEGKTEGARNVTMGAKELLGSLVREVEALREEVDRARVAREASRQGNLLTFIRSLPEEQQRSLTESAPDYVLDCMRKLVDLALARAIPTVGNQWNPKSPVLIPGKSIFAELCIMQVVQGYLLAATEEDQAQQLKLFGSTGLGQGGGFS